MHAVTRRPLYTMGPSKTPTKAERDWLEAARAFGCIACRIDDVDSMANMHHIVSGNRRMGHLFSIPLCYEHHQGGGKRVPSVHMTKRSFVARYGTELELLESVKSAMGL